MCAPRTAHRASFHVTLLFDHGIGPIARLVCVPSSILCHHVLEEGKIYAYEVSQDLIPTSNEQIFVLLSVSLPIGQSLVSRRAFLATSVAIVASPSSILTPLEQFDTVNDIPADYFSQQRYIYAYVERVIDGDTIRARHLPAYTLRRQRPEPLTQRGIANLTMSLRVYGVDTPELGKNKRQTSQPFAEEAKDLTESLVYHKVVKVTLLRRDQYGRAVAMIETVPNPLLSWFPGCGATDLSLALAQRGLAELYTGGGAEYNGRRDILERAIEQAKRKRRGQWSIPDSERQSAAEKKKEIREGKPATVSTKSRSVAPVVASRKSTSGGKSTCEKVIDVAMAALEVA